MKRKFWVVVSRERRSGNDPAGFWYPEKTHMTRERARINAADIIMKDSDLECRVLPVEFPNEG